MRTVAIGCRVFFLALVFSPFLVVGQNYVIYSIAQDLPMGFEGEKIRKNFYVNMGSTQGLRPGTELQVFREMVKLDPFEEERNYPHQINIGPLEVIHTETHSAIAIFKESKKKSNPLVLDIPGPMVGDRVSVVVD